MRSLTLICSLYMMLLAFMPCKDEVVVSLVQNQQTIQKDTAGGEQCNDDACPPFCTCACCSVVRHFLNAETAIYVEKSIVKPYLSTAIPAVQTVSMPIWQPPQNV